MIYNVNDSNINEFTEYINTYGNLFQRIEWIKSNGINEYFANFLKNDKGICIAGTYIFIDVNGQKCIYFPRGPVFSEKCDLEDIKEYFVYLKDKAISYNCKKIFLDCKYDVYSKTNSAEIESNMLKLGAQKTTFSRFWKLNWAIDISNLSIEDYLAGLKEKTRYNINYAKRKGVKVCIDNSEKSIKKFYDLLLVTAKRDKFMPKRYESYARLFENFGKDVNLFWTYIDDVLLSAAIHVIVGDKAYYLYGASSNCFRNCQPTYLMHYEMIKYSMEKGCKVYNMGGVGTVKNGEAIFNEGLYDFKRKFGGFLQESSYMYVIRDLSKY